MINVQAIFLESLTHSVNAMLNQPLVPYLAIGFLTLVFLLLLLKLTWISLGRFVDFKYKSLGRLFSEAEQCFFHVLKQSLSDQYEIFAKVRIADLPAIFQVEKTIPVPSNCSLALHKFQFFALVLQIQSKG